MLQNLWYTNAHVLRGFSFFVIYKKVTSEIAGYVYIEKALKPTGKSNRTTTAGSDFVAIFKGRIHYTLFTLPSLKAGRV